VKSWDHFDGGKRLINAKTEKTKNCYMITVRPDQVVNKKGYRPEKWSFMVADPLHPRHFLFKTGKISAQPRDVSPEEKALLESRLRNKYGVDPENPRPKMQDMSAMMQGEHYNYDD
jgi:hypothetical protein